jgi:hypothetical protein
MAAHSVVVGHYPDHLKDTVNYSTQ